MKKGGVGGAHTQKAGQNFEDLTLKKLLNDLEIKGYQINNVIEGNTSPRMITMKDNKSHEIQLFFKASLYKHFMEPKGIDYKKYFSMRLEPDTAIYSVEKKVLTIIEKKQQTGSGSVAEKLQTCDFKRRYYETLINPLGIEIDLVWQLGKYFLEQKDNLQSIFEYMLEKGSSYYFLEVPIDALRI